jgi:4'-phosphopantetheinyl transferase
MPESPATVPALAVDEVHVWLHPRAAMERSGPGLRRVLPHYLGQDAQHARVVIGEHGQPRLAAPFARLGFSASHAGAWLMLAFALDLQPGIDIEAIRPRPNALKLADRYFPASEAAELRALPPATQEQRFYQAWTAREAILKATGRGIAYGLDRLRLAVSQEHPRLLSITDDDPAAWQLHPLQAPDGHVATVAWRGPPRRIRRMPD